MNLNNISDFSNLSENIDNSNITEDLFKVVVKISSESCEGITKDSILIDAG